MKKHLNKIIIGTAIVIILALCYWWGGSSPALRGWNTNETTTVTEQTQSTQTPKIDEKDIAKNTPVNNDDTSMTADEESELASAMVEASPSPTPTRNVSYSEKDEPKINFETDKDKYDTETVPTGKPVPSEPANVTIADEKYICTLSVRCDAILANIARLNPEKVDIVPKDGVIFASTQVDFYEGESVFNLLKREMKKNKIHMEFVNTPIYNSAYIEGIANLYECDCGELSGWMYKVNGWFPNYGCSRYELKPDDNVEWVYTCDLGNDVGGYVGLGGGQKDE